MNTAIIFDIQRGCLLTDRESERLCFLPECMFIKKEVI